MLANLSQPFSLTAYGSQIRERSGLVLHPMRPGELRDEWTHRRC